MVYIEPSGEMVVLFSGLFKQPATVNNIVFASPTNWSYCEALTACNFNKTQRINDGNDSTL
jgi:hypothetical protein